MGVRDSIAIYWSSQSTLGYPYKQQQLPPHIPAQRHLGRNRALLSLVDMGPHWENVWVQVNWKDGEEVGFRLQSFKNVLSSKLSID